jgi:aspartyl-tRNA(Asn)/glutamyl-tRNA(Gln) amidotransferase subunit B
MVTQSSKTKREIMPEEIRELGKMDSTSTPSVSGYYIKGKTGLWKLVIGLEIHAQIKAATKLFSPAATSFGESPNSSVSIIDAAIPGTLPIINQECVDQAIRSGLAIHGKINLHSMFDRKHYFYCDLPSGYQITQYQHPVVSGGHLDISLPDHTMKSVAIERIQLETDSGKSLHDQHAHFTFVDLNRVGSALMEIVSMPDMSSPIEAGNFVKKLQHLLKHINTCDGNMEEGSLRCDANVSVQPIDSEQWGTRCEIKNLNTIKGVMRAIEFEAHRHVAVLESGGVITQQTRFYDPSQRSTSIGRKKEDELDYRFFPEPDLPHLIFDQVHVDEIAAKMPELPDQVLHRLLTQYHLTPYDADVISNHTGASIYFEKVAQGRDPKEVASWIMNEIFAHLKGSSITDCPVSAPELGELLDLIKKGTISGRIAKDIITFKFEGDKRKPSEIVDAMGLKQVSEVSDLELMCKEIIDASPNEVEQLKAGRDRVMKHFVGEIMKRTKGKAAGPVVTDIFKRLILESN